MRRISAGLFVLLFAVCIPATQAQSAVDQATLSDLKTASQQMQLEAEGVPAFRLGATYEAFDFMGRPDSYGTWTEEFARAGYRRSTMRDSASPENYAPEDQTAIGAPAPATSGTFMQRFLVDAFLRPGPTDAMLDNSKLSYKPMKIGALTLRCVVLEPKDIKDRYQKMSASRAYCLAPDSPTIRLAQLQYGLTVTYNSLARYGGHLFAQQVTAQQRNRTRGKLQVGKVVAAPELSQANLPKEESNPVGESGTGHTPKIGSAVIAGSVLSKVTPVYPIDSKQKHISGVVVLHAIISKEGTIESLEVMSAPADDLAESAIEAVSQWRYKPYLLNGMPTEVDTTVTVHFSFG